MAKRDANGDRFQRRYDDEDRQPSGVQVRAEEARLRDLLRQARNIMDNYSDSPCLDQDLCGHDDCTEYRRVLALLEAERL